MSDDVARAVGAGGKTIKIAGKECKLRPLSILELTEIERDCLKQYKMNYLETFYEASRFLPEGKGEKLIEQKLEEIARWDITDLPPKYVYDPEKIKMTNKLQAWLKENMDYSEKDANDTKYTKKEMSLQLGRLAATALDEGVLEDYTYESFVGEVPKKMKTGYVQWWLTGCYEGMLSMVWVCFKSYGVTKEEVAHEIGTNPDVMIGLTRDIESLSAPDTGNG